MREGNQENIKWQGYPHAQNTWEETEVCNCPQLIHEYEQKTQTGARRAKQQAQQADRVTHARVGDTVKWRARQGVITGVELKASGIELKVQHGDQLTALETWRIEVEITPATEHTHDTALTLPGTARPPAAVSTEDSHQRKTDAPPHREESTEDDDETHPPPPQCDGDTKRSCHTKRQSAEIEDSEGEDGCGHRGGDGKRAS